MVVRVVNCTKVCLHFISNYRITKGQFLGLFAESDYKFLALLSDEIMSLSIIPLHLVNSIAIISVLNASLVSLMEMESGIC